MKREYTSIIKHRDGTYSGIESTIQFERLALFKKSVFKIGGYYDADQEELTELLFLSYKVDGLVMRRIFDECTFSFRDFTREQIDDVMQKIGSRKKPSTLCYAFINCRVLSDDVELKNYPFIKCDSSTKYLLEKLPPLVMKAATHTNVEIEYDLKDMRYHSKKELDTFAEQYHEFMTIKRHAKKKRKILKQL